MAKKDLIRLESCHPKIMGVIVDTQNAREKTIYVAKMLLKIKHFVNIKMHDEILRLSFKNANSEASM